MYRFFLWIALLPFFLNAQLSGTLTVPGNFVTLAAGIAALNSQGISGPLTLQVAPNYTELIPAGGYSLYTSGTAQWPITIAGNASNQKPIFISPSGGSRSPGSVIQDGMLRLIGCDFVTITGLEFRDNNTTAPQTMEFGIGLFKASAVDGCHDVKIQNCFIYLNSQNNTSGNLPACDGARGIEMVNAIPSAHTTSLSINSVGGTHHHNSFYGNRISNCNYGIALIGFADQSPFTYSDTNNEIGGALAVQGNTIINFGGGGTNPSAGIRAQQQQSLSVLQNILISNTGAGNNHPGSLRGIQINTAPEANARINSNTITLHGAGTSAQVIAIENQSGSGGTGNRIDISNNVIVDGTYVTATSGNFYGIYNTASSASLSISDNNFLRTSTNASSGSTFLIYNTGPVTSVGEFNNNEFSFEFDGDLVYTGLTALINIAGASSLTTIYINGNQFGNVSHRRQTATGVLQFINLSANAKEVEIKNNIWKNIHLNHSGPQYCINNSASTNSLLTIAGNTLSTYNRMEPGNFYFYYGNTSSAVNSVHSFSANLLKGYTSAGSLPGNFTGIQDTEGNVAPYPAKFVTSNTITNVLLTGTGNITGIQLSDIGTVNQPQIDGNLISDLSGRNQLTGILISAPFASLTALSVSNNTVSAFTSDGVGGTITGLSLGNSGAGLLVYKNKVADLQTSTSTGSVNGVHLSATGNYTLQNNFVAELRAINSAGTSRMNGILVSAGTFVRLYYNTVQLSAVTGTTMVGSNALFCSSTPSVDLRNNILINLSGASGTAQAVVYRRSTSALTNYQLSSNCNIFFTGTTSPNNFLYAAGTTLYQNIVTLQTAFAPRESLSFSQIPSFTSLNTSSALFLHLSSSQSSPAESSAIGIANITDDIDGDIRQGNTGYAGSGTAPDIGADEVNSYTLPCSSVSTPLIYGNSNLCQGQVGQWFAKTGDNGTGLAFQWKVSSSATGPFLPLVSMNSVELSNSWPLASPYFILFENTCQSNSISASSAIFTVNVQALPVVSISAPSVVCAGTTFSLLATGSASDFFWNGPAAFTSNAGVGIINQSGLFSAGVYTLRATLNGCEATQQTISINVVQVQASVSAVPNALCVGGNSTLTVNGNASVYLWNGSPGPNSIVVSPSQTSSYSLQAIGFGTCSVTQILTVTVITPTIAAIDASICAPANNGTIGVKTFSPSFVNWYTSPQSLIPVGSGTLMSINIGSGFMYARASLMQGAEFLSTTVSQNTVASLMFDLLPTVNVALQDLELAFSNTTTCIVSIYYRSGSFQGFTNSSVGWSLLGTSLITSPTASALTSCNFSLTQFCAFNQVSAWCIAVSGNSLLVSPSTATLGIGNSDFTFSPGLGGPLFNVSNNPLLFAGRLLYSKEICSSSLTTIQVLSGSAPSLTVVPASATVCPGTTTTLSVAGAQSYLWSTGSTASLITVTFAQQQQTLMVTGKSNIGCSQTVPVPITIRAVSLPTLTTSAALVCPQQTVQLIAGGALSYTWAHGPNNATITVNVSAASIFKVFATDSNGCVNQNTLAINTRSVPVITISALPSIACPGEPVQLSAQGALSYTWLPMAGIGATVNVLSGNTALYNAIGTAVNTCTGLGYIQLESDLCTSVTEELLVPKYSISPHPAHGCFSVKSAGNIFALKIIDVWGRLIYMGSFHTDKILITCETWSAGYYTVLLSDVSGVIALPLLLY